MGYKESIWFFVSYYLILGGIIMILLTTKEEIHEAINNWEGDAGEDFLDYFDGSMNEYNFMFWCLGKGYITEEQMQAFESAGSTGSEYLVGDEEYSVIQVDSMEEPYDKGNEILAEFFSSTKTYQKRVSHFIGNITEITFKDAMAQFKNPRNVIYFRKDGKNTYLKADTPLTMEIIQGAKWYRDDNRENEVL
jgi:hypothetical protein